MCEGKVCAEGDINITPPPSQHTHTRRSHHKQSTVTYAARAQVLNLPEIILSYSSQWIFVILGLDFSNSAELSEEDLTLAVGAADTPPPEVIIIHSQSQYRCVVKTRAVSTSNSPVLLRLSRRSFRRAVAIFLSHDQPRSRWQRYYLGRSDACQSG